MSNVWDLIKIKAFDALGHLMEYEQFVIKGLVFSSIAFFFVFLLKFMKSFLIKRLRALHHPKVEYLKKSVLLLLNNLNNFTIFFFAVYWSANFSNFSPKICNFFQSIAYMCFLIQIFIWCNIIVSQVVEGYRERKLTEDPDAATNLEFLTLLVKIALGLLLTLVGLDSLGINVTALIAGLGIGGIAVALAAQNFLTDVFASLSIVLDRPFVLGDFIVADTEMGTIEKIGLRTTHLRSLTGEQLIFANADLLKSRIRNYKRMNERRIVFSFGIAYSTTSEQINKATAIAKEAITNLPNTRFDRAHFAKFSESSLDFEVVYWVETADYNKYMDLQQKINLSILENFSKEKISFAYPSRNVFLFNHATT